MPAITLGKKSHEPLSHLSCLGLLSKNKNYCVLTFLLITNNIARGLFSLLQYYNVRVYFVLQYSRSKVAYLFSNRPINDADLYACVCTFIYVQSSIYWENRMQTNTGKHSNLQYRMLLLFNRVELIVISYQMSL